MQRSWSAWPAHLVVKQKRERILRHADLLETTGSPAVFDRLAVEQAGCSTIPPKAQTSSLACRSFEPHSSAAVQTQSVMRHWAFRPRNSSQWRKIPTALEEWKSLSWNLSPSL